jgi:purine-binding chemotaxis protein CheW
MTAQPSIDWRAVHERLQRYEQAARETLHPTPERSRLILEERARALSQIPVRPPSASEVLEVVTFELGSECYALETRQVRRVVKRELVTPIPGTSELLVGVVNLQGEILLVFDLRVLFGVARQGPTEWSRVVVLGEERDEFGVLADAAQEVRTIRVDALFPVPDAQEGAGRPHVRGVTGGGLIVLDGSALLRDDRLIINQVEEPGA